MSDEARKWEVRVVVELEDAVEKDEVLFGLPWTDVVGPNGDITVMAAEEVEA